MKLLFTYASMLVVFVFISQTGSAIASTKTGKFIGQSNHKTSGNVTLKKTSKGWQIRLSSNFNHDGAPDPWLGFGKGGKYDKSTTFTKLKSNNGAQIYLIPGKIKLSKYNELYVWCKKFGVKLGVAKLASLNKKSSVKKRTVVKKKRVIKKKSKPVKRSTPRPSRSNEYRGSGSF